MIVSSRDAAAGVALRRQLSGEGRELLERGLERGVLSGPASGATSGGAHGAFPTIAVDDDDADAAIFYTGDNLRFRITLPRNRSCCRRLRGHCIHACHAHRRHQRRQRRHGVR